MPRNSTPQPAADPPRPAWRSGGPYVEAAVARLSGPGFDEEAASEIVTSASRIAAAVLAEGGEIFDLMRAMVRVASAAVHGARGEAQRRKLPVLEPACDVGCAHCCEIPFSATAPEVLVVAAFLRQTKAHSELAAIRARMKGAACPLLAADRTCTAYPVRPMACAGASSLDAEACARRDAKVPVEPMLRGGVHATWLGLSVALRARGLDPARYEFARALSIALAHEDAEARWLAGDAVFASARVDDESLLATCDAFVARDEHLPRASVLVVSTRRR